MRDDAPSWSLRLGERFCCRLESTLADWLDSEMWKSSGAGEFHHAVYPDSLLADYSDVVWPGLMLPDTLPLVGNRYGDWLCMRVGADNTVTEFIHWYHGGGDWIPWGRTLAEAILFDSLRERIPGRRQVHAVEAEPMAVTSDSNPYLTWALQFTKTVPTADSSQLEHADRLMPSIEQVLEMRWCEVAVRCELALNALDSRLRQNMTPEIAQNVGVAWEPNVVSWLFDCNLVPDGVRPALEKACDGFDAMSQNWEEARLCAKYVASQRDDLVWAFDVAGWSLERQGNFDEAAEYYRRGVMALAFADQSIRFRTHWYPQSTGKFSTWRLLELIDSGKIDPSKLESPVSSYLSVVRKSGSESLRVRAMHYWQDVAREAVEAGRWADAYSAFYRAGWDLGTDTMIDFGDLLKGLVESAKRAGQSARAAVAQFHHDAFIARFG